MELKGKIIQVMPAQSGVSQKTGNSWMSQSYLIEIPGQYPKKCVFRVFGEDRIKQFDLKPNDDVTVSIDIDAREYNGKWYNDISCYRVSRDEAQQPAPQAAPSQPTQQDIFPPEQPAGDDLPF